MKCGDILQKVTWLGQAGLLFELNGCRVMIDPYLSDSVKEINPNNYRRQPVDKRFFDVKPDVMIFTHNHLDHFDPETVKRFLKKEKPMTVLAPFSVWGEARKYGGKHNYVQFDRHTEWTEKGVTFRAVKATHSDTFAIGVIIRTADTTHYVTGDTLYSERVFASLPSEAPDVLFLPINGRGNNMNSTDAARFAQRIAAKHTVPIHFGMFDEMTGKELICENRIIPRIYEEIVIPQ